jgi:hypothetical protein
VTDALPTLIGVALGLALLWPMFRILHRWDKR